MEFVIPAAKITGYLLADPSKRGFFVRCGYRLEEWERLRDDLLRLAQNVPLSFIRTDMFGRKYQIVGDIRAPDGRVIQITTGWIAFFESPQTIRFVTAYPA